MRGEEQNRQEGEMAQKKLGGGRNRGKKLGGGRKRNVTAEGGGRNWLKNVGRREKLAQKVGRREIYPPVPPPFNCQTFPVWTGLNEWSGFEPF